MYHDPVMLQECIHWLDVKAGGCYMDATFGGGGHSRAILNHLGDGRLIAFDRDTDAHANRPEDDRLTLVKADFRYADRYLRLSRFPALDGILADLGISSHQIDEASRGFSTRFEGPLDMRMDREGGADASRLIEERSEAELSLAFYELGDIANNRKLAAHIKSALPITSTAALVEAIRQCIPPREENKYLARVFQTLRILVNDELGALNELMEKAASMLKPGGRMVVMSYHSAEDRIVKNHFRSGNAAGKENKDFFGNNLSPWKLLFSKPVLSGAEELERNPRSRSAKLRAAERL
jgi:16S rRNA (cytosine1402-N4)-methyltransferase